MIVISNTDNMKKAMTRNKSSRITAAEAALGKHGCCPWRRSERIGKIKAEAAAPTTTSSITLAATKASKLKVKYESKCNKKKARVKPRRKPSSRVVLQAKPNADSDLEVARSFVPPASGNAATIIKATSPKVSTPPPPSAKKKTVDTMAAVQQLLCQEKTPPKTVVTAKAAAMTLLAAPPALKAMTNDNKSFVRGSFEKTRSVAMTAPSATNTVSRPSGRLSPMAIPSQPLFSSSNIKNGTHIQCWSRGYPNTTPLSPLSPKKKVSAILSPVRLHKIRLRRPDDDNETEDVLNFLGTLLESPPKPTPPAALSPSPSPCSGHYESAVVRSQDMHEAAKNLLVDMEILDDIEIEENYEQEVDIEKDDVGIVLRSWVNGLYREKTVHSTVL